MSKYLTKHHPLAKDLEISVENVIGIGLGELSMAQLNLLEDMHLSALKRISDSKVGKPNSK